MACLLLLAICLVLTRLTMLTMSPCPVASLAAAFLFGLQSMFCNYCAFFKLNSLQQRYKGLLTDCTDVTRFLWSQLYHADVTLLQRLPPVIRVVNWATVIRLILDTHAGCGITSSSN